MIKLAGVALQIGFDVAQAPRPAKLRIKHRDQMRLGLHHSIVPIGTVLVYKPIEHRPRNMLQQVMKNDILMRHDVDPFASR